MLVDSDSTCGVVTGVESPSDAGPAGEIVFAKVDGLSWDRVGE